MKRSSGIPLPILYVILTLLIVITVALFLWGSSPSGFSVMTGQTVSEDSLPETKNLLQCSDSDGQGVVQTAGSVALTFSDGSKEVYTDVCEGSATIDYACDGINVVKERFTPSDCSCQNGACIQCVATECNPSSSQQICSNGRWVACPSEQVCTLGRCETPTQIFFKPSSAGGGGGGSSEPVSSTSSPSRLPETVITLGTLSSPTTQDIGKNEKLVFTIASTEYTLKTQEIGSTLFQGIWTSAGDTTEHTLQLSVGGEITISTFTLKLKSINTVTSKAKFLIVPPSS